MGFIVRLASDTFEVDPGNSVAVAVEVTNESDERDHFELSIEGLEHHWTAVPVPSFTVDPGETRVERFFLKPPRDSESAAGNYPFVVKLRSLESGDAEAAQGNLSINPYYHLSIDMDPRKSTVSPLNKSAEASVTVMNLGNVEQTVQLFANDVDDAFAYEFQDNQLTLSPGQQVVMPLTATATKSGAFSPSRLHVVTVSCRNVENPGYAATVQGQIEQRPLISPAALIAFAAVMLIALLWVLNIPKDPTVSMTLNRPGVLIGEPVTVQWRSEHATSIRLLYGDEEVPGLPPSGTYEIVPREPGEVDVRVIALGNGRESLPVRRILTVTAPEVAPDPVIEKMATEKQSIPVGQPFILEYRVSPSVTRLTLEPYGTLPTDLTRVELPGVPEPGSRTYILRARNADGKEVTEELTLRFVEVVDARIVRFEATPMEVDPLEGRVTLVWQFTNAVSATLEYGGQSVDLEVPTGRRDFLVSQETAFKVTVFDANGLTATRTLTVKVKQAPPTDPPTQGDGDTDSGRTSTTGTGN